MDLAQKAKVRAILEQDCEIVGKYIDDEGRTCAIGALLLKARTSPSSLNNFGGLRIGMLDDRVQVRLQRAYGLSLTQADILQQANDGFYLLNNVTDELRRADVLRVLDAMEVEG